jgi:hypothetical protein
MGEQGGSHLNGDDVLVPAADTAHPAREPDRKPNRQPTHVAEDNHSPLVYLGGNGWIERKATGGVALYWYQRYRDRSAKNAQGNPVKRSKYIAPCKGRQSYERPT